MNRHEHVCIIRCPACVNDVPLTNCIMKLALTAFRINRMAEVKFVVLVMNYLYRVHVISKIISLSISMLLLHAF